jgi:hypothetical protein
MMIDRTRRLAVGLLAGLVALTSIGGGIAMLLGAEAGRFPLAWLSGTPFSDYTIPALLLVIVVGGSALAASVFALRSHPLARVAALLAGLILIGYIVGEVLLLKQEPPGPTWMEIFYFALGLLMCFLAWGSPGKPQQSGEPQT